MGAVLWGAAVKGDPRAHKQESARLEVPSHGPGDRRCSACCWLLSPGCSPVLASLKLVGPIQSDRWWARRLRQIPQGALIFDDSAGRLTDYFIIPTSDAQHCT